MEKLHQALDRKTRAEACGISVKRKSRWKTLIQMHPRRISRRFCQVLMFGLSKTSSGLFGQENLYEELIVMFLFTVPFSAVGFKDYGWRRMLKLALLFFPFGFAWDWLAGVYLHIWYWNPKAILGIKLIGLPLEEYLFIVMLPWMLIGIVMTLKRIEKRYNKKLL